MTSDDSDTQPGSDDSAETVPSGDEESTGPPRDPETGRFLPEEDRPAKGDGTDAAAGDPAGGSTAESADGRSAGGHESDTDQPTAGPDRGPTNGESETMSDEDHAHSTGDDREAKPNHGENATDRKDDERDAEPRGPETDTSGEVDRQTDKLDARRETPGVGAQPSTRSTDTPSATDAGAAEPRSEAVADRRGQSTGGGRGSGPADTPTPRTLFVPKPDGYPRSATVYLPSHPWLRLPSRPPTHETVSVPG